MDRPLEDMISEQQVTSSMIFQIRSRKLTYLTYREEVTGEDEVAARIIGRATMQERYVLYASTAEVSI